MEPDTNDIAHKLKRFNISSLDHTFENFKASNDTVEAAGLLKKVSNGESPEQFILIYGTTGCGKTHLIEATVIGWVNRGLMTRYFTFSDIAMMLKSALLVPLILLS